MELKMDLKNCKKCGQIFVDTGEKLCPDCLKEETEKFKRVRDYLWDNPGANVKEVHQETNIPIKVVRKFVREGRFVRTD